MESDLASDDWICGKSRECSPVFQFVPAGFDILRDKSVPLNHLCQGFDLRPVCTNEPGEHGPRRKHVHAFRAPRTANLKILRAVRESNSKVHFIKRDMSFVISVFLFVFGNMVLIDTDQIR